MFGEVNYMYRMPQVLSVDRLSDITQPLLNIHKHNITHILVFLKPRLYA